VSEEVDADADEARGCPAAAVYIFLEEKLAGDGVGDQRERRRCGATRLRLR